MDFVSDTVPEKLSFLNTFGSVVAGNVDAELRQPLAQRHRIQLERAGQCRRIENFLAGRARR